LNGGVVQVLAVDPGGNTVASQNFTGQNFALSQAHVYTLGFTPAVPGTFVAKVGVFSSTGQQWYWNAAAASITVTSSLTFSSTATASPASVTRGSSTSIAFTVTDTGTSTLTNGNIELQVFDASSNAVVTQVWSGQSFTGSQNHQYSYSWNVPGSQPVGAYTAMIGVFDGGWSTNYSWNNNGASITVVAVQAAPAAPNGLTATPGNGQVMLSWSASSGASSYNVYRGAAASTESVTPIATGVTTASYTDGGLTNGTPYFYKVAAVNGGGTSSLSNETSAMPEPASALRFVPITPCRVADTRVSNGAFGSPSLAAGVARSFTLPGNSSCSIPNTAAAYSVNVTVVPHGPLGFLTVWPSGQTRPVASTLNSLDGRIKANAAIIPAGASGAVSVYASNATDLVLDIDGYFVPASNSSALAFYPLAPCRIADTRKSSFGTLGPPALVTNQSRTFAILSGGCGVPGSAQAYSLNFTAVPAGVLGFITAYPTGQSQPLASTLNALTGAITANAAIVPAGSNGSVDVFTDDPTNLVIDINGYFAPPGPGGLSLYTLSPCRVLDTRLNGGQPFSGEKDVNVTASGCGAPAAAQAYVFNATVVPPGLLGFLTLWPQGGAEPVVSTLNALDGTITSNMAIVPSSNGLIAAQPLQPTQLVLDLFGYFAP